jgi:putative ABC transport system permease protein
VDPTGRVIRVKNVPFTVIGMLDRKGQSPFGQDQDDLVLVPVTTFQQKVQGGLKNVIAGQIAVSAISADATGRAQSQIRSLLRDRHRLGIDQEDDFQIRNLSEVAAAQAEGTRTITTLLMAIAAVSLFVGGIGIMNIMLVSVTERTREIGVRMAVGARARDIQLQFLVEALTLSMGGGLIGVALGVGAGAWLASAFGWSMLIRPDVIVIAVAFSALVGVGFGFYPALKASRLDPITALRFE